MKWKGITRPPALLSFSFLVMIVMIVAMVFFISIISFVSFSETRQTMDRSWNLTVHNTENHLKDSMLLVSKGLRLFELTYDSDLKSSFRPFLAAYSAADGNPYKIDLVALKKGFPPSLAEKLDLYIIDKDGVVINTTYSHDMGLDFKQWPTVFTQITAIREGNSFQSDRAVKGFHFDTVVRKFAYHPTPDHQYLLELSITIDEFHEERSDFSYGSAVRAIRESNPHILSITLYDTLLRKTYHSGQKPFIQSNATKDLVSQVFRTRQSISIQDQAGHTAERYIFIPTGGDQTVSDTMLDLVAHISYNTNPYNDYVQSSFQYSALIALISVLLAVLLAYFLTYHLTRPVRKIIDDIDTIAQGNLDHPIHHTGSSEFVKLEGSISTLVASLKFLITTLKEKEQKIISSEHLYRSLIESQTDILIRYTSKGEILYVNDAFCLLFGRKNDEVVGTSLCDLTSGDMRRSIERYIENISALPERETSESSISLGDGTILWIQWNTTSIWDEKTQTREFQAVGRDITRRKEAEIALQEQEEQYHSLISNLPDYVIVHRDTIIIYVNESAAKTLGYEREDLTGKNIFDYIDARDHQRLSTFMEQRKQGIHLPEYQVQIRKCDNSFRTAIVRSALIPYGGESAFLTVLTDITDRIEAEDQIVKGEQKYRQLVDQLNEGIWITNEKGLTTYINSRIHSMLGYDPQEILNTPFQEFIAEDEQPYLQERICNRRKGIAERYPLTFITKTGERVFTEVSAVPSLDDEGRYTGSFAVVSDITRRKEAELKLEKYTRALELKTLELESVRDQLCVINDDLDRIIKERTDQVMNLLRQKDEFIMQLGHDLRTPLTPILGLLPDLIKGETDPMNQKALHIIRSNVRFIQDIAEKTLKLAKLSSFDIKPDIEPVEIRDAINDILEIYAEELSHAGITITNTIPQGLSIGCDRVLFQELIENIISNAIKYIKRQDGEIVFSALPEESMVSIRIQDNGSGLRAEETEKIFEVFYKSDRSRHDKSSTGLGLSICKRIVDNHGGCIRAESPGPGLGTSFIILLPEWKKKS